MVTWKVAEALTKNIAECDDRGKFKEMVAYDLGKIVNARDGPDDIEKVDRRLTQEETMALPGVGYFDIGVGDPDQLAKVVASLDVYLSGANSNPATKIITGVNKGSTARFATILNSFETKRL